MPPRFLLLVAVLAQLVAAPEPPPASLDGRVVTVNGDAIRSAMVELRGMQTGTVGVFSATTGADGAFAFRHIPPGRYQLTAMRGGYVRGDHGLHGPGRSGITIELAPGERLAGVRLAMRPTGTLAGHITNARGEGIGNVHVKALRFSYQDGRPTLTTVRSVFTDDRGEYRLGWLAPGLYYVSALHADARVHPISLPEVTNSAITAGTAVANAGGRNASSANASIGADPANRARLGLAADHDYVPVYYPGTTSLDAAQIIEVRPGIDVDGLAMIVSPVRTASIAGTVGLLPVRGVDREPPLVHVSRFPSYNLRSATVPWEPQRNAAFSVNGLAPGSYLLAATSDTDDTLFTGYTVVSVSEGSIEHVHVPLQRGIDIPLRVVREGDTVNTPLTITLRRDPIVPGLPDTPPARNTPTGGMVLQSVIPGDYLVNVAPLMQLPEPAIAAPPAVPGAETMPLPVVEGTVTANLRPERGYVKAIRVNGIESDGRLRIVDGGAPPAIEIVIGATAADLDGMVIDAARRPAPHAVVVLMPAPGSRYRIDRYTVGASDARGRFRFEHVPPGDYTVFAWEDVESWSWLAPQFMQRVERYGAAVRLTEGATAPVVTTVIPAQ